jgi:uncharacterized membrane protein
MQSTRWAALDAVRGVAMVWMTAFHFCFDLQNAGYLKADFYNDVFWTGQRTAIVSLFLLCAGAACTFNPPWPRFWRRWAQIVGAAMLVSAGSYLMFPQSFIYFGVLHGMAVMTLLTRVVLPLSNVQLLVLGAVIMALPQAAPWLHGQFNLAVFNTPMLNWLGLISHKPITEDYVPLMPWLGVLLWGLAAGLWVLSHRRTWMTGPLPRALRPLALLGRWSLSFYMVHQPVMLGALWLWQRG